MNQLRIIPAAILAILACACASIGRPEGGPRDENPPEFMRSSPMPGATGVGRTAISLYFDENIELEDAFNKVVVSPVQMQAPTIRANGRRITVELRDTLVPDMTYTIDFGDAIKDLNEGNVLDGFALDFSTGASIDSLRLSGIVLGASNLEPAQGILVGAYSNLADSAIRTLPPDRIARTNQLGQFTIRNLAPGRYRVYAFNDLNRDFHWDRSEDVAFLDTLLSPGVENITVTDTLYSSTGADSLITRPGRRFVPNDILLSWFNQNYRPQYIKDYKRIDRRRASILLGAPPDSLTRIAIVGTAIDGAPSSEWAVEQRSVAGDSIVLWLRDSLALANDSLMLAVTWRKPDSLEQLHWATDTLRFFFREPKKKKKEEEDTVPPRFDLLQLTFAGSTSQDVNMPLTFTFSQPVESLDTAGITLETLVDTVWTPVPVAMRPDSLDPLLTRRLDVAWSPGAKYRLKVDSAAVRGIYGEHNPHVTREITVKPLEEYSNLTFNITGGDSTVVVQLLNSSDAPVAQAPARDGRAVFRFITPGTYYARLFFDTDGNGEWSTGILDSIQPEEVAYYPKKLDLKRNWDIEQAWDIYELPVDMQKPRAILKNKPKLRRGEEEPVEEEETDEDQWLGNPNDPIERRRANSRPGSRGNFRQAGNTQGPRLR